MKPSPPSPSALRVSDLSQTSATCFAIRPEAGRLKEIAADLDLLALRKLSFEGEIAAKGKADWRLTGKLGATVVQPCAVTLEPVTTRIDLPVSRLYQRDFIEVNAPEAEMPEDDTVERLTAWIDPGDVMIEALVLALPLYPRAEGAELSELVVSEPGVTPMRDENLRPFSALAALQKKLASSDDETGGSEEQ